MTTTERLREIKAELDGIASASILDLLQKAEALRADALALADLNNAHIGARTEARNLAQQLQLSAGIIRGALL